MQCVRMSHGYAGFVAEEGSLSLRDCQFKDCMYGSGNIGGNITLENVLAAGCTYPIAAVSNVVAINVTADGYTNFCAGEATLTSFFATDCLATGPGTWVGWDPNGGGSGSLPSPLGASRLRPVRNRFWHV